MKQLTFSAMTIAELRSIARITEHDMQPYPWTRVDDIVLSQSVQQTDSPTMHLEPSREYIQRAETDTILKILKRIVTSALQASTES